MIRLLYVLLFLASITLLAWRPPLARRGSIEFEKRVNRYALFKKAKMPEGWYEDYIERHEQFFTSKSTMLFSPNKALYYPGTENGEDVDMISSVNPFPFAGQNNTVYTDFAKRYCVSKKIIYDRELLVKDSLQNVKWKLTDEFREVAGYNCRRANGLIMDSVYVVAFYTNEIHLSGGPESFNGLPGMILEVFLPHDNVSWKALKVTVEEISDEHLIPPSSKSEVMSRHQLEEWITTSLKTLDPPLRALLKKGLLI